MDFSAEGILARMKASLKNEDTRIEGSFTMDNLQAVAEELARFNAMRIVPLMSDLAEKEDDMGTSGNEKHYVRWAKEAVNASGSKIVGNAKVNAPRDGTGFVSVAIISVEVRRPTADEIRIVQEYIDSMRPVGAYPVVSAAESVPVVVAGIIRKEAGYTAETVLNNIKRALTDYFAQIAFQAGTAELNYFTVSKIINATEGVKEIESLTVNGAKESITVEYNKYFALEVPQIDVEQ